MINNFKEKFNKALVSTLVASLVLLSSPLSSLIEAQSAHAATTNITKIAFTAGPVSVDQNAISPVFTIETQNSLNNPETITDPNIVVKLSSGSTTGTFSTDNANWQPITEITLLNTQSSSGFYYMDPQSGKHTLTVTTIVNGNELKDQKVITVNDITAPKNVSINNITDGAIYNATTMPDHVEGLVADDDYGQGVNQDSTTYLLRNGNNEYWNGTAWTSVKTSLQTAHFATADGNEVTWASSSNFPKNTDLDNGTYHIIAQAIDKSGNKKDSNDATEVTFHYDSTAPSGSVTINNGTTDTYSKQVSLTLSYDNDATEMRIANKSDFTYEAWIPVTNKIDTWTLSDNLGYKNVYVQFRDQAGNVSSTYCASITHKQVSSPNNFKAEAKDGSVKLTWDKVADADHYDIQYRKANTTDTYTYVSLVKDCDKEITNLTNNVEYEFQVRAVDALDHMSEYTNTNATPKKAVVATATYTTYAAESYTFYDASAATSTNTTDEEIIDNSKDDEATIETEGATTSEDETEGQTQGARTAVTIGIIIIAIGAALGGYYGYQWWMGSDEEEEEKKEEPKKIEKNQKPKKNKSNRRW